MPPSPVPLTQSKRPKPIRPKLLLDDLHDGRAIFAWAVDYVEKVPLDADGRCFVVLLVLPRVDVRNERHVDPRDLETVARETLAAWRALV